MSTPQPPNPPGKPDPWAYPAEAAGLAAPPPDLLASPAESGGRRRGRLPILVAAATVVAVLLGAVAYAGMRLWYGSGAQPEEAAPSTVVAFARLDLSPGYGQRRKIDNLLKKFPRESGKDAVDELKQKIFQGLEVDEAAYRKHVEPWFAERVGVALWMDDKKRPYGLMVLATDSESAARTGLAELQRKDGADEFGFVVRNGYALVAHGQEDSQVAADAAGKDAERESLAASAQFRQGVDWLPGQQTALAWSDLAELGAAMRAATESMLEGVPEGMPEGLGEGAMPPPLNPLAGGLFPGMPGLGQWSDLKGHVIVGAQATDDGVEIRFRGFGTGAPAEGAPADARSTVDSLPANSAVAGSFRLGDLGARFAGLVPPSAVPESEQMLPEELLKDLPPGEAERALAEMRKSTERFRALDKALSGLSGAKISFAVSRVGEGEIPALTASAETTSADKAAALAQAGQLLGGEVTVTASGNRVELKTKGYTVEGGTLAGQALYRDALNGAPAEANTVLYLDVQRLLAGADLTDKQRGQAKPVRAVGLATGTEGGDPVGLLRVLIG